MTSQVTVIRVFLASPSDVAEERQIFDEVIAEVNKLVAEERSINLRPVKFETDVRPGVGSDAQDVINTQIGEYDIFVGILWHRFGTPTGRAESGTSEEFERALARHQRSPRDLRILFYFKTAAVDPMTLDLKQLGKVHEFREQLKSRGLLYGTFSSADDFRITLRAHIAAEVKAFGKEWGTTDGQKPAPAKPAPVVNEDEPGIVELILDVQDSASLGVERMEAFTKKQLRLTQRLNRLRSDISGADMSSRAGIVRAKQALERAAGAMMTFAGDVDKEMPLICESAITMAESMSKAILLSGPTMITAEQRESIVGTLSTTSASIGNFRSVLGSVRESIPVQLSHISGPMRTAVSTLRRALTQADVQLLQASDAVRAAAQLIAT